MVDFYEVHSKAINAAKGRLRLGETWNVALREPLPLVSAAPMAMGNGTLTVVRFRALPDGRLEPCEPRDKHEITEWNARHKHTPRESFCLPPLWRS